MLKAVEVGLFLRFCFLFAQAIIILTLLKKGWTSRKDAKGAKIFKFLSSFLFRKVDLNK
jgi:hypothetical protein